MEKSAMSRDLINFSLSAVNSTSTTPDISTETWTQFDESLLRYSKPYLITSVTVFSILFLSGFIGNILVIYVVCKSSKMRTLTNYYLVSLAASDCLVLIGGTLPAIPEFFFYQEQWLYGAAMCSILVFLQYLGINASALSITAFTVERYIGICHPIKAQVVCTVKRARYIIAGLWVLSILYNACWIYLAKTVDVKLANDYTIKHCTFRISREMYRSIFMVDLMLFYVVPLMLFCVFYTLIGVALRKSTQNMKKPLNREAAYKPTIQRLVADRSINKDFKQSMMGDRKDLLKKMAAARLQVVKMLIVVSVMFAVLWLPYRAWLVYNSFASEPYRFYNKWFYLFARSMVFLSNAMNPILYSAMSKKFRTAFIQLTPLRRCIHADEARQRVNTHAAASFHQRIQSTKHVTQRKVVDIKLDSPLPTPV